jgi:hypothetical protein
MDSEHPSTIRSHRIGRIPSSPPGGVRCQSSPGIAYFDQWDCYIAD